jgi:hypothetical protein
VQNQTCEAGGVWSGGGPISCTYVDCGDVPGLLNGAVHVLDGRTTYGARIKVGYSEKESFYFLLLGIIKGLAEREVR